ncbi:MAG: hypothetical protein HF981_17800 [Desulfobacteraceae bacterium]|nr:hypothetical protein [Desulfobacteraceae bacterium]MBC2752250.1 hypothetical protein [Desulfobacteraceae bacterium]
MTTSIDIAELNNWLQGGEPMTVLDVRRPADADANPRCIAGAVYRDPEKIDAWVKELPAGKRAVVYCVKGGSVSQSVSERLRKEGIEIDVPSVMEEFDSDQDGRLSQEESQSAMESLHEQVGPPPPPMGGMEGPMKMGTMSNQAVSEAYSQSDDDQSAIDQLLESLSETDDEADKSGIVQEWLQTLMGNNQSYSPVDIRI